MKLKKVHITEFRSVLDSNEFDVDDVTCLVGKNESGKTAILEGLYRLNPIEQSDGKYDVTDDYPRLRVSDYEADVKAGKEPAIVCSAIFELDDNDLAPIVDAYGSGVLASRELRLSKGYSGTLYFDLAVSEPDMVAAIIKRSQLPEELAEQCKAAKTLGRLQEIASEIEDDETREHLQRVKNEIAVITDGGDLNTFLFSNYISKRVPRFLYFGDYWLMKGQENIQALQDRRTHIKLQESDHPLLGLIELAGLDLDALVNPKRTQELKNRLEGAGNRLTREVLKYWSQNRNLSMRFDIRPASPQDPEGMRSGTNFWAEIYDSKHWATTSLGRRSKGFVWFFSFLAYFSQQKKRDFPIILLLDEPGLSLHGTAQADLLRYIEQELKPDHQVIYTTHSPFMVDPQKFERVRIVQDKGMDVDDAAPDEDGTKVLSDVLEANNDTLFPLQGALGYEIHQTLFVGPNMLVVEGASDLLYLQVMSGLLAKASREGLSEEWVIVPVGGAGRVPAFVSLLKSQKHTNVATLMDIDKKNQQIVDNVIKLRLLKKSHVLTFGPFCGKNEADIEDMFERDFYFDLLREEFGKEPAGQLKLKDLQPQVPRILVAITQALGVQHFNHYRPSRYFTEQVSKLEKKISAETLDRFEAAFKAVNALLPKDSGVKQSAKGKRAIEPVS